MALSSPSLGTVGAQALLEAEEGRNVTVELQGDLDAMVAITFFFFLRVFGK